MRENLRNRNNLQFDMIVYHETIYNGKEPLKVVGIRKSEVELYGDYSGMGNGHGSSWLPLDGVTIEPQHKN